MATIGDQKDLTNKDIIKEIFDLQLNVLKELKWDTITTYLNRGKH